MLAHGLHSSLARYRKRAGYALALAVAPAMLGLLSSQGAMPAAALAQGCSFVTSPGSTLAFCETFDAPAGTGNRSGGLNGTVWGVSRATSDDNPAQGLLYNWAAVQRNTCGTLLAVLPSNDATICNGQYVEGIDDNAAVTVLAAYPKQPFDIAGRTGTAVFDVSNDTQGPHTAWPAFVYTDQPVPAPYSHGAGLNDSPRNSFGVSFATACGQYGCLPGQNNPPGVGAVGFTCVTADSMWITSNYQLSFLSMKTLGCVLPATQYGVLSHVEVHLSGNHADVWASDPGQTSMREIASADGFTMPLSRGLIWMEDVHYNAEKCFCGGPGQRAHTFVWDNVGFDGPPLARDLAFDVPDNTVPGPTSLDGLPTQNLGYFMPGNGTSLALQVPGVSGVAQATAGLLTLTYWPHSVSTLSYSVNGHAWHTQPWPFASDATFVSQTLGMPVPLSEVTTGTNTIQLTTSDPAGASVANLDLVMVGAGGGGSGTSPAVGATATPTTPVGTTLSTPTPLPTAVSTPGPITSTTDGKLGLTTPGSTLDGNDANSMEASRIVVGSTNVTAQAISVYVGNVDSAPHNNYSMAIYTDHVGIPTVLVAQTGVSTLIANSWNTLPIAATLKADTPYWLAYGNNGSNQSVNGVYRNQTQTNLGAYGPHIFGSWPTDFGAASIGQWQNSIYVAVVPAN
jgi:hypothetical protein